MSKNRLPDDFDCSAAQEKVMDSYWKKGYILDKQGEDALHMSFSPYRVPKGLSKHQVIAKIAYYKKYGKDNSKYIFTNRMSIYFNDKFSVGLSFVGKVPDSHRKMKNFLKKFIKDF